MGSENRSNLQTASEVKSDLQLELSNLDYPDIRVHIASNSHFQWDGPAAVCLSAIFAKIGGKPTTSCKS